MALYVDIEKKLGNFKLSMKFEAGDEVLALLGASGCGKSMTLKCIAGIEKPDRGRIVLDGVTLFDSEKHINLPPQKRQVGYLFQQYALFPNMTVEGNIRCGLRGRACGKKEREKLVSDMIRAMHLEGLEKKKPAQLSGGQQQRTALARILINAPELLLLDEPFSALDSHLRFQLEKEVSDVAKQFGKTVLLVSHNRDEVFRLSDTIAVINNGTIDAIGSREEIFTNPRTRTGAILTGCKNISEVEHIDETHIMATSWGIPLVHQASEDAFAAVGIRMHYIEFGEGENSFRCKVEDVMENPFSYTLLLRMSERTDTTPLLLDTSKEIWKEMEAEEVTISIPKEAILLLK